MSQKDLHPQNHTKGSEKSRTTRTSNPMAFSSILSSTAVDVPKPVSRAAPSSKQFRRSSHTPNGDAPSTSAVTRKSHQKAASSANDYPGLTRRLIKAEIDATSANNVSNVKATSASSEKEKEKVRKEIAKIEAMELSDIDSPTWATAKENHALSSRKRYVDVEENENIKRKVSIPTKISPNQMLILYYIATSYSID